MALNLTADNFEKEVLESTEPVLVDFYADWCGPCQMLAPIIQDISDSDVGVKVGKVNTDEQVPLAMEFGVKFLPTVILFKDGKATAKSVGLSTKEELLKMIEDANGSQA